MSNELRLVKQHCSKTFNDYSDDLALFSRVKPEIYSKLDVENRVQNARECDFWIGEEYNRRGYLYIRMFLDDRFVMIQDIQTLHSFRGRGLATFMLSQMEEYSKEQRMRFIIGGAAPWVVGFWKRRGYEVLIEDPKRNSNLMHKSLL